MNTKLPFTLLFELKLKSKILSFLLFLILSSNSYSQTIGLLGNAVSIANNDATPSLADHTDFGQVNVSASLTRTFTIENTHLTNNLDLNGAPIIEISGLNAGDFSVTVLPVSPVLPSTSTTFELTFTPSQLGMRTAIISIANNDPAVGKNPFIFYVQGIGANAYTISSCESFEIDNGVWVNGNTTVGREAVNISGSATSHRIRNVEHLTTSNLNLSAYEFVEISFDYRSTGFNNGSQSFSVQFSDNEGVTPYQVLGRYNWTTNFTNGVAGTITLRVNAFDYNFNSATSRFRIQCESANNARYINVDNVCITGHKSDSQKIKILGNELRILNNSVTPNYANNTDFGRAYNDGGTITKVFTIQNKGGNDLTLTGMPVVDISGANAADFTVNILPSTTISSAGSTSFEITFDPSDLGLREAIVTIDNDDSSEGTFMFFIQGTGINALESVISACQDFEATTTPWTAPGGSRLNYQVVTTNFATRLRNVENIAHSANINLTNFDSATISFDYKTEGYTGAEGFLVQFSDNSGGGYTTIATYTVGSHFQNGVQGRVVLTIPSSSHTFNASNRFRIISAGNATSDIVWLDNLCLVGVVSPVIQVQGNTNTININDLTPSLTDHTSFGAVNIGSAQNRIYTINNTGSSPLNISSVTLTGVHAADYSIVNLSSSVIPGGGSATLEILFTPSLLGERNATINIASNDAQTPTFSYRIKGVGFNTVSTELYCQDFENSAINTPWTGGTNLALTTVNGSTRAYRLRTAESATTPVLDFENFDSVELNFDFRAEGHPAANGFRVEFSDNGGLTYASLGEFLVGTNLTLLESATKSFRLDALTYNFNGKNKIFRIVNIGSTTGHILYLDDVCIVGYRESTSTINVVGNTFKVPTGSVTTTLLNHTNFGLVDSSGLSNSRTFTIQNLGGVNLNLGAISLSGAHTSDFSITTDPSLSTILPAASASLTIQFTPSALGLRTVTVSIPSDDPSKNPYTFLIQGTGVDGTPDNVVPCSDFDTTLLPWVSGADPLGASTAYNFAGTAQSYRVRNVSAGSTNNIDLSNYSAANITFDYIALGYSGVEGFRVRFSDNAGASYTTLATYTVGVDFQLSERGMISLDVENTGVAPYNFSSANARFRIESIGDSVNDIVYADNICITGIRNKEMKILGNSVEITNNDKTPSDTDHTDFGNVTKSTSLTRTFTIQNTGSVHFNLTGTPLVAISGADAASFNVSAQPSVSKINGLQSVTFEVTFNPTRLGSHLATLTVANDTSDKNPYVFDIQGRGVNAATTLLNCEGFETNNGIWTTGRTNVAAANIAGSSYSLTTNNVGTRTTTAFDLSAYEFVEVTFNYRTGGYANFEVNGEDLEGFALQFKDHNSITYFDVADYVVDTDFVNDIAGTFTVRINAKDYDFTGNNNQFRFTSKGSFTTDILYVDNICIYGFNNEEPKINIRGNNVSIANGDTTPSLVSHTDFGFVYANASNLTRTFTIENKGGQTLNLTGTPRVQISGVNAGDFSVSAMPSATVAPGASTTFQVVFTPTAEGLREAVITIPNNDTSNAPYVFDVYGTGVNGALVDINCNDFEVGPGIWNWGDDRVIHDVNGSTYAMRRYNQNWITTNVNVDLRDYTFVAISFDYRTSGYADGEGFMVRYSSDATANWTTIGTFIKGVDFENGVKGVVSIGLPATGNNFNTGEGRFRIHSIGNANSDRVHFDDVCIKGIPKQEIQLQGNSVTISNNDFTPSVNDHTDFGNVNENTTLVRTFTIANTGGPTVDLTNVPIVEISGDDAASFVVTAQPAASFVLGQQSLTFQITFSPTRLGMHNARVTIANSTTATNPYIFDIQGRGINPSTTNISCAEFQSNDAAGFGNIWGTGNYSNYDVNGTTRSFALTQANTRASSNLNLSSYEFVEITFDYKTENYTADEGFAIEFKDNVSTSFVSLAEYTPNTGLVNNISGTKTVRINSTDFNFSGGNNQIRIAGLVDNDNTLDRVYVDNVCVYGYNSSNPKINVRGNNNSIAHNSISPSLINHSDFGYVYTQGAGITRTFTVQNLGTSALNLTGAPMVSISGANAADFNVSVVPSSPIAGVGTTTFNVYFLPSALGLRTATITIASNDPTTPNYTFAIQGTGVTGEVVDINCQDFEAGQGIWTSAGSPDTGNQRLAYDVNGSAFAYRVRNGGFVNTSNVDLSNYGQAIITFYFRTLGFTGTEGFRIRFSDNGGAGYTTIATYTVGTHFVNGAVGIASAIVNAGDYNFTSANARFRIESLGNANTDRLHFDDVCIKGIVKPSIQVEGNASVITNGFSTPRALNDTDFGSVNLSSNLVKTFTVRNTSLTTLNLTGTPRVSISGANPADFVVTTMPSTSVSASGTTTFQVTFTPSALGIRSAIVSIDNDSGSNNPYVFSIQGRGTNTVSGVLNCEDFQSNSGLWNPNRRQAVNINGSSHSYRIRNAETGTSSAFNFSLYDFVEITFHYRTANMQDGQGFAVQFSPNGGTSYTEIANYVVDVDFQNNVAQTVTLRVNASDYNFGGINELFRFVGKSTSNRDVYIDDVCVVGYRESTSNINVKGKGLIIVNGDTQPSLSNHTDFGPVYQVGAGSTIRTFTIENIGNVLLNLTGSPRVSVSGVNAADFTVTAQPAASVAISGNSTFQVRFQPSALGVRTALITIESDDPTRNPYTFTVQGTGVDGIIQNIDGSGLCNTFETGVVPAPTITWSGGTTNTTSQVNAVRSYRATQVQALTSSSFDLTNYRIATITFDFKTAGYSGSEGFSVLFTDDGGTNYYPLATYQVNTDFANGTKYTVSFTVTAADYIFNGNNKRFRILSIGDTAGDLIYIDDVCITGIARSNLQAQGNSTTISNNDFTPTSTDHTDFGNVNEGGNLVRTFTINNIGGATLNLTNSPLISVSGEHASDFVVTTMPSASVAGGGTTTFQVTFTPSEQGVKNAILTINSDDDLKPIFTFGIKGTGTNAFTNVLNCEEFEVSTGIWSGGTRQAVSVNGTTNSVRLENVQTASTSNLDFTNYEYVEISFDFKPEAYLAGQGFVIEMSDDGGVTHTPVSSSLVNINFTNSVSGTVYARVSYTDFDFTGTNERFRIRTTGASAARFVNIDNVCIKGYISNEPKVLVRGNSFVVTNGDVTPSLLDHTDFGQTYADGGSKIRTFTIQNIGGVALNLTGTPRVAISGAHAGDFSVNVLPPAVVNGSSNVTFEVTFAPTALGLRTAILTIQSNDATNGTYVFNIQGTGTVGQLATISCQDFETDITPWLAPGVQNVYNVSGSLNSLRLRDNDNSTTDYFDLSNFLTSTITFDYRTEGYVAGQGFRVEFLVGGTSTTLKTFIVNTDFENGKRGVASFTVNSTDFNFSIANNNRFRIRSLGSNTTHMVHVDNVCIEGVLKPSFRVEGNSTPINNNDLTPTITDHTDFGNVNEGGSLSRTFTVNNTGGPALNLTGTPRVVVSGVNASEFVVTALPNAYIPGLSTSTFEITFTPTALGMRNAIVTIANDNATDNPYVFAIQGRGTNVSTTTINCEDYQVTSGVWSGGIVEASSINHTSQSYKLVNAELATSSNLDFNNFEFVELTFDYRAQGYSGGQTFDVRFSDNGGTSLYSVVNVFQVSNDFENLITSTKTVRVYAKDFDFSGANERFIIKSNGSSVARILHIDNVCITGYRRNIPIISVKANELKIENGDVTPDLADFTDFWKAYHDGETIVKTFTINNFGGSTLNLTGTPRVQISGAHAADFVVTTQPAATVGASSSSNFEITFNPSAIGMRTATVTIASNDADDNPFVFNIQGEGVVGAISTLFCQDFDNVMVPLAPWIAGSGTVSTYNVSNGVSNVFRLEGGQSMISDLLDLNDYFTSTLTFDFKTEGYTGVEGFRVYRSNCGGTGGCGYLEMDELDVNVHFYNGVKGRLSVTVNAIDHPNFFASANEVWRVSSQGGAGDIVYIDNVCITGIRKQTVQMQGNSIAINNNDLTPSSADHTDFGNVNLGSNLVRTFAVANLGGPTLTLTGTPKVTITGPHAADFTVTTMPADQVFGNSSSPLGITFTPSALGMRTAYVTVVNDDPKNSTYVFAIQGKGSNPSTASVNCQDFEGGAGIWSSGTGVVAFPINGTPQSYRIVNQESTDTSNLNLSDYEFVELTFDYRAQGFTGVQTFDVQFSDNAATSMYILQKTFQVDVDFDNTTPRTATIRVNAKDYDFTGNNNRFRIKVNGTSAGRILNIDNVCITGFRRAQPIISVRGNDLPIVKNDVTPSFADHTNFGNVYEGGATLVRTFTIRNIGGATLNLTGTPLVAVSGAHASDFTVNVLPSTSINASSETTFQVTFNPSALGVRNAILTIASNDTENNPYVFNISGTGVNNLVNLVDCQDFEVDATPWLASGVVQAYNVDGTVNALKIEANQNTITNYFDFTTYESVTISFDYKSEGYVGTEGFRVEFGVGGTFTTLKTYQVGTDFVNGFKGSVSLTVNATDFPPFTTNNKRFRITSIGSGSALRKLFIDQVCIAGVVREPIEIRGNNNKIANGDIWPDALKHTDFETFNTRQYTIFNTTGSPITITSIIPTGGDAARFSIVGAPASIPGNSSANFTVVFNPLVVGPHNTTIRVTHSGVTSPYEFSVLGTGIPPTISVTGNGIEIPTGSTAVSGLNNTYFGSVFTTSTKSNSFSVVNTGTIALNLTGGPISFTGGSSSRFTVFTQPAATVLGNSSQVFVVRFSPNDFLTHEATVSIPNDIGPAYLFNIMGEGKEGSFVVPGCVGTDWLSECPDTAPINLALGGTFTNMNVVSVSGVPSVKWNNPSVSAGVNASMMYNITGLESNATSIVVKFTLRTDVNSCTLTGRGYTVRMNFAGTDYMSVVKPSLQEAYNVQYMGTTRHIATSNNEVLASKLPGGCVSSVSPTTFYVTIPKSVGVTSGNLTISVRETSQEIATPLTDVNLYISNVEATTDVNSCKFLWLKADAGISDPTNGALVPTWRDQSTLSSHASQTSIANRPVYVTNSLNFNPGVDFLGNRNLIGESGYNSGTQIVVFNRNVATNSGTSAMTLIGSRITDSDSDRSGIKLGSYSSSVAGEVYGVLKGLTGGNAVGGSGITLTNGMITTQTNTNNPPSAWIVSRNGVSEAPVSGGAGYGEWAGKRYVVGSGVSNSAYSSFAEYYTGQIQEILSYPTTLTTTELQRVQSYLAIKYGLTLGHNYLRGDGTVVYDISTYGRRVFGIAKENCQGLHQRQAKSESDNSTAFADASHKMLTIGYNGIIANENSNANGNDLPDDTFVIIGDNNNAIDSWTAVNAPTNAITEAERVAREWKVQTTGAPDKIRFKLDGTKLPAITYVAAGNSPKERIAMVIASSSANIANATLGGLVNRIIPMNKVGNDWEIDVNLSPDTTEYFTFIKYADCFENLECTGTSTTWTGVWSNGVPNATKEAIIATNYSTASNGEINACKLTVNNGITLTINSNTMVQVQSDITNNGSINIENSGSLMQFYDQANNSGSGTYSMTRNSTPMYPGDYTYWSSPFAGFDISNITKRVAYYRNPVTNQWIQYNSGIMQSGLGYIAMTANTDKLLSTITPVTFSGTLFTGRLNITLPDGGNKWNLIGNPYPSAIDADEFIFDNSTKIEGGLYFWTHFTRIDQYFQYTPLRGQFTQTDYAIYTLTGGTRTAPATTNSVPASKNAPNTDINGTVISYGGANVDAPNGYIAAGQAFFVASANTAAPQVIQFKNCQRTPVSGVNDQFFKGTEKKEKDRFWVDLMNEEGSFKQLLVGYMQGATDGVDKLFDATVRNGSNVVSIYSITNNESNGFAKLSVQGRKSPFNSNDKVPVGFTIGATARPLNRINLSKTEGLFNDIDIYLHDKLTDTIHNLKKAPYDFISESGTYDERFVIKYKESKLDDTENISDSNSSDVIVSQSLGKITVTSKNSDLKSVTVYSLLGEKLYSMNEVDKKSLDILGVYSRNTVIIISTTLANGKRSVSKIVY